MQVKGVSVLGASGAPIRRFPWTCPVELDYSKFSALARNAMAIIATLGLRILCRDVDHLRARRHRSEATCWHTRAGARHQPRWRKMLFHSPPGIFDPTEHAVRRLGSEASAVGVDRGQ